MINSVVKALNLLLLVNDGGKGGLSLVELADLSGMKVPTTHNMLVTLEQAGFLERDPASKRYVLGAKARQLGEPVSLPQRIIEVAMPLMEGLCSSVGETTILAYLHNFRRKTLIALESRHLLRVGAQEGGDDRIYDTATGRILLSMLSDEEVKAARFELGEPGERWREATSFDNMLIELEKIRKSGYVEYSPGDGRQVQALAVPVKLSGAPPVSIGVFYPLSRYSEPECSQRFLEQMGKRAAEIEKIWLRCNMPGR